MYIGAGECLPRLSFHFRLAFRPGFDDRLTVPLERAVDHITVTSVASTAGPRIPATEFSDPY
jgi:hypothetical protein